MSAARRGVLLRLEVYTYSYTVIITKVVTCKIDQPHWKSTTPMLLEIHLLADISFAYKRDSKS